MIARESPVQDSPACLSERPPPELKPEEFSPEQPHLQKHSPKVLVPTDFSVASARAVEFAVTLAEKWGAELTLLHVIDINAQSAEAESLPAEQMMSRLWQKGVEGLARLAFVLNGRVHAKTVIEEGLPCELICEKSAGFDFLLMGKTRPKPAWKLFSRQTVQRVLQNAACPVIVAPPDYRNPRTS